MNDLRKYLQTLPWEYRLLYAKYIKVKSDADVLKQEVNFLYTQASDSSNS
jgi:hypothetical protein